MIIKKYLIGLAALAGLFSACTDLEPEIYSNLTTSNAYGTESDIDAAVVGLYSDLTPYQGDAYLYYAGYLVMTTDYATDMGYSTAAGDPTKLSNMTYDSNNRYFSNNWKCMYTIITNANIILANVDQIDMSEENKNLVKGQAKFLRALAYRDLTDAFGPVPLLTELVDPFSSKNMPLTPVAEIEDLLISDLKECIEWLPKSWTGEDLARATKGAAATLLGKIYLRNHDYTNARIYIDQVLSLRDEGIYALENDFKYVWSENNKYGKEMIFCILHESSKNGGEITNHFGPSDHPDVPNRWQYYGVSLPFWRKYDKEDPRREFFYYDYTGVSKRDDNSDYGFHYMVPEEGVTEVPNDTTKFMQNVATMKYSYDMISEAYYDGRTMCVFRLSDVILCKAEIENNLNGPSAALPYLNEIRARAGAPEYGKSDRFPIPSTKEAMNQAILDERGYELVFEFQRRADLLRFGKYEETVNAHLAKLGISHPTNVTPALRYFPYPLNDAQLNSYMAEENPSRLPQ